MSDASGSLSACAPVDQLASTRVGPAALVINALWQDIRQCNRRQSTPVPSSRLVSWAADVQEPQSWHSLSLQAEVGFTFQWKYSMLYQGLMVVCDGINLCAIGGSPIDDRRFGSRDLGKWWT